MLRGRNVVFIHAPKCGGTSIGQALRLRYFFSQSTIALAATGRAVDLRYPDLRGVERFEAEYRLRETVLLYHLGRGVRCVSAHVQFSEAAYRGFADCYAFVTVLRDPVARFLSHYYYVRRHHPEAQITDNLEQFLETETALRFGSQYLFYFGGAYQFRIDDVAERIEAAVANLTRFDLVGDLSDLPSFRRQLQKLLGVRIWAGHRNKAPEPTSRQALEPHLKARIAEICAPDLRIYEAVCGMRLGERDVAALRPQFAGHTA